MNYANTLPGMCRLLIKFDNFYLLNFTHFDSYHGSLFTFQHFTF